MEHIKWAKRQIHWLGEYYCYRYGKEPKCRHFEECNSCPLLNLTYSRQIKLKEKLLELLFEKKIEIVKSKLLYRYRNKAEFSFIDGVLGFRKKNEKYKSFPVKECFLVPKIFASIARFLQDEFYKLGFESWDVIKHKGFLAYVVMRYSFAEKSTMVNFVTHSKKHKKELSEIAKVLNKKFGVESVNWIVNESYRDEARGVLYKSWYNFYITEILNGIKYKITPQAFFQTNPKTAELLFKDLLKFVDKNKDVADLYCGIGAISLLAAKKAKKVVGIELEKENVKAAKENAKINKIKNVEFLEGDAYKMFKDIGEEFNTVIVDPPRAGLSKKLVKRINNLGTEKVIYVSCNPFSLAQNLEWFSSAYNIKFIKGYDFYPHTPHLECLVVLEK